MRTIVRGALAALLAAPLLITQSLEAQSRIGSRDASVDRQAAARPVRNRLSRPRPPIHVRIGLGYGSGQPRSAFARARPVGGDARSMRELTTQAQRRAESVVRHRIEGRMSLHPLRDGVDVRLDNYRYSLESYVRNPPFIRGLNVTGLSPDGYFEVVGTFDVNARDRSQADIDESARADTIRVTLERPGESTPIVVLDHVRSTGYATTAAFGMQLRPGLNIVRYYRIGEAGEGPTPETEPYDRMLVIQWDGS